MSSSLKVKTKVLQDMMKKAIRGAGNNKLVPLTSMLNMKLNNMILSITTYNGTNYTTVKAYEIGNDPNEKFNIVAECNTFDKLVSKTTSDYINLTLNDDKSLTFEGNGKYTISLPLNENDELIVYPKYQFNTNLPKSTIKLSVIKSILQFNKSALATSKDLICLTDYLVGMNGTVVTADSYNMCINTIENFNVPMLLKPELLDLLDLNTKEDIKYQVDVDENKILFSTSDLVIYGTIDNDLIDQYPYEVVKTFLNTEFSSSCTVGKQQLLNVLDRLSLFIGSFDINGVYFAFTKNGLQVENNKGNAIEHIDYHDSNNFTEFSCVVGVDSCTKLLKSIKGDYITMYYGDKSEDGNGGNLIKIVDDNITQILATFEDADN